MNDLDVYGLNSSAVLADLDDLMNLLGNPFASLDEDDVAAGTASDQNDLMEKMQGENLSNNAGGNNNFNSNSGSGSDQSSASDTLGGNADGSPSENGGDASGDSDAGSAGKDAQGESGDNAGDDQSNAGGSGDADAQTLHDRLKGLCEGGQQGGKKNKQQGGQQGGKQDGQQSGQQSGQSDDGAGDQGGSSDGSSQSGKSADGEHTHASGKTGMSSSMTDHPDGESSFGDDLGESSTDFKKRMNNIAGKGIGTQARKVNFRGLEVDMDAYTHSNNADIVAMNNKGKDESELEGVQEKAHKLVEEAESDLERKERMMQLAEEDERLKEETKGMSKEAIARGRALSAQLLKMKGCVDWKKWLTKRLSGMLQVTDHDFYNNRRIGGLQSAYNANGIFLTGDVKKKVKTRARVELFFDTSGSIGDADIATFFREVAKIMEVCHAQVMRTAGRKKGSNDQIKLYIYCWDDEVLCNARVKSPEELIRVANSVHGGGGTDPNSIFRFKAYNDGLKSLPETQQSHTGVTFIDNMKPSEYKAYLKDRKERLAGKQKKAINETITIVFTDYGFGAVKESWVKEYKEWARMTDSKRNSLLWVCLPNCVSSVEQARKTTPFGDICLMPVV